MMNNEPAVFISIVASDKTIAEMEERERLERERRASPQYQREHKRNADIAIELLAYIGPFIEEARQRGFHYFRSLVDYRTCGIQLQFADGKGKYYLRAVSLGRLCRRHGTSPDYRVASQVSDHVYIHLLHEEGFGMLDHGMMRERVKARGPWSIHDSSGTLAVSGADRGGPIQNINARDDLATASTSTRTSTRKVSNEDKLSFND
jgi:hypothetical protein